MAAALRLFDARVTGLDALAGAATLDSTVGVEVRGYTSQEFPKNQYSLEARSAMPQRRPTGAIAPARAPPRRSNFALVSV